MWEANVFGGAKALEITTHVYPAHVRPNPYQAIKVPIAAAQQQPRPKKSRPIASFFDAT